MNLYLIGYRCSGKSAVGSRLASRMNRSFIDTDAEVVRAAGESIRQIVEDGGWDRFRKLEQEAVDRICRSSPAVVATGGGVVLAEANVRRMKKSGVLVWLKAAPETIRKRMQQDGSTAAFRPALAGNSAADEIETTLAARTPFYQKAQDFSVDTDELSVDGVCDRIGEWLNADHP